jgi:hypothetical protein
MMMKIRSMVEMEKMMNKLEKKKMKKKMKIKILKLRIHLAKKEVR